MKLEEAKENEIELFEGVKMSPTSMRAAVKNDNRIVVGFEAEFLPKGVGNWFETNEYDPDTISYDEIQDHPKWYLIGFNRAYIDWKDNKWDELGDNSDRYYDAVRDVTEEYEDEAIDYIINSGDAEDYASYNLEDIRADHTQEIEDKVLEDYIDEIKDAHEEELRAFIYDEYKDTVDPDDYDDEEDIKDHLMDDYESDVIEYIRGKSEWISEVASENEHEIDEWLIETYGHSYTEYDRDGISSDKSDEIEEYVREHYQDEIYEKEREYLEDDFEDMDVSEEDFFDEERDYIYSEMGISIDEVEIDDDDVEHIASVLKSFVGFPEEIEAEAGYQGTGRDDAWNTWKLETDGDNVELVSPPRDLEYTLEYLPKVLEFIRNEHGTNSYSGLHIGVSYKGLKAKDYDLLKLALFLGEDHVTRQFDRFYNNYAARQVKNLINNQYEIRNAGYELRDLLNGSTETKTNLLKLIDKIFYGNRGSFNVKNLLDKNYIEFRMMGNEGYQHKEKEIIDNVYRMAYAMKIASDPDLHVEEYMKKLAKLVNTVERDGKQSPIESRTPDPQAVKYADKLRSAKFIDKDGKVHKIRRAEFQELANLTALSKKVTRRHAYMFTALLVHGVLKDDKTAINLALKINPRMIQASGVTSFGLMMLTIFGEKNRERVMDMYPEGYDFMGDGKLIKIDEFYQEVRKVSYKFIG